MTLIISITKGGLIMSVGNLVKVVLDYKHCVMLLSKDLGSIVHLNTIRTNITH
jgi:hypothetical protein